jgi:prepilin-type N-terminal cleavage/methylation domain-containing protein
MIKFFKKANKNQKGFTLIELLIVIVILGVLAAAIIPNLSRFTKSGKLGAANAEVASVQTAVAASMADNGGTVPAAIVAATAGWYNAYFASGKNTVGAYSFAATTGEVTGTAYSALGTIGTDYHWDATNRIWALGP